MKFLHAADLHLDTPFIGISNFSKELQKQLQESTYQAAKKLFDTAVAEQVDFVILAGDVFDDTDSSLKAQMFLRDEFEKLKQAKIKVYLIYGNHDYYRNNFAVVKFPDNVTVFGQDVTTVEQTTKDGQRVGLTGFSYYKQHINDAVGKDYPQRGDFDYQIGILHAGVGDDNYAPFQVSDLLQKGYDYWALGHIHKRQILHESPMIVYSGDIQGRNQNDITPKGFYIVSVENHVTQMKFVKSSVYTWDKASIEARVEDTADSLINKITDVLSNPEVLLTLTINNAQKLSADVLKMLNRNEILQHFSNVQTPSVLYKIYLKFNDNPQLSQIDQKYWDEAENQTINLDDIKDLDSKLYSSSIIRDHINDPDFLKVITEMTRNTINQKYTGE
ncbi:metallophosphoesterase family protein [Companilactobacillus nantensis]|uniref:Metallo-phosphoesterase n=1 Tax=Companilactobacillus nantensis DSM 16982 TaxID=1423774 RepID=A0A0R1WHY4_9LACO|nr:DNA repair exonuclease [Companilactobacillus nantensis]KRM17518.1 metallo-phosphoesterase [Companilactobacillus nantensis DSM 16982]GEO65514.1 DNA repair exonuclease [Companilactobacillus nantensis]